jgi:hypothetical protein
MTTKRSVSLKTLIALLLSLTFGMISTGYTQVMFEKGYIIDKNDNRIECQIKNMDWKNNPEIIKYKIAPNDEEFAATVETIKEFQVYGYSRYILAKVDIDRSPDELSNLTTSREPKWSAEELFLKVLVDNKASLYKYESANFIRFFYSTDSSHISQLVHKEFLVEDYKYGRNNTRLGENNTFQQQLLNEVNCGGLKVAHFKALKYSESVLVKFFQKYNKCRE